MEAMPEQLRTSIKTTWSKSVVNQFRTRIESVIEDEEGYIEQNLGKLIFRLLQTAHLVSKEMDVLNTISMISH
ncbi:hypothetical protein ACTXT7_008838 [Hymenolepis weldensis]